MKFNIIRDDPCRLRVRFGKYIFTKEQGFGLMDELLSFDGVNDVTINHQNGSILILHNGVEVRNSVIKLLTDMKMSDLKDGFPTELQKAQQLENEFKTKVIFHCLKHTLRQLLMPSGMRKWFICYRALTFLRSGFHALNQKKLSVEVLDATAIGTALCCKKFQTASSTMFLLQLSDLLLEYSNMRTKNALAQSLAISIDKVWVLKNEEEIQIQMNDLIIGDIVVIRTGALIPIDGTIVSGDALINEATMTGEPIPVHKTSNGTVFAGTVLEDGELYIRVDNLKNDSRIANILNMIDHGEKEKAGIQGKAEKMADQIVPLSFGMFFASLILTRNFARALSVLMVDFSCAIKLTTPITIISGLKECVSNDILVKGGKYLETLSKVDTIVFDKTGTLTNAIPQVSNIIVMKEGYTEETVLRIAACLEEHFPHSVACAIVAKAKEANLLHPEDHDKVEYIVAHGIASSWKGIRAIIGSKHFIFEDEGVEYPKEKEQWLESQIGSNSAVYLAVDHELVGIICITDPPREDAKQTILDLRQEGIKEIIMITGDSEGNAKYTSEVLGIDKYYASILPEGKAKLIEQLKEEGKTVLMVGDGINDTPALSTADVSLTLNGSSDIAREVADIAVLSDELSKIVTARKLATGLMQKIYHQYGIIVTFNTVLIMLGLGGVVTANTSAYLHNASTLGLAALATKSIQPLQKNIKMQIEEDIDNEET